MQPERYALALMSVAENLARARQKGEVLRQAELRRSVSTAYYALFHAVRLDYSDFLVGRTKLARESKAWTKAYRTLNHGPLANASGQLKSAEMAPETLRFYDIFADLKSKRERADYEADNDFSQDEVDNALSQAKRALTDYKRLPSHQRRAALALVLGSAKKSR